MVDKALAQLRDIHMPNPIGFWPLAPGWWVVIVTVTVVLLTLSWWAWQHHLRNKAKKQALKLLGQLKERHQATDNAALVAQAVSALLKRVAIAYFPRHQVAGLSGLKWLAFLDKHSKHSLFAPHAELLLILPYRAQATQDLTPLFMASEQWIKQRGVRCLN